MIITAQYETIKYQSSTGMINAFIVWIPINHWNSDNIIIITLTHPLLPYIYHRSFDLANWDFQFCCVILIDISWNVIYFHNKRLRIATSPHPAASNPNKSRRRIAESSKSANTKYTERKRIWEGSITAHLLAKHRAL